MRPNLLLAFALSSLLTGCTHIQLKKNFNRQVRTLSDVQEQQVLDNLARFAVHEGSTPFFAVPSGGGTTIFDGRQGTGRLNFNPYTSTLEGRRTNNITENFTLTPINDPDRLEIMKCLYLHAVHAAREDACLNCLTPKCEACERSGTVECSAGAKRTCNECKAKAKRKGKLNLVFGSEVDCLPSCFFTLSGEKPKQEDCCFKVGSYCGRYVIVEPYYFDELSRLTMAVLEVATMDSERLQAKLNPSNLIEIAESFKVGKTTYTAEYSVEAAKLEKLRKGANDDPSIERLPTIDLFPSGRTLRGSSSRDRNTSSGAIQSLIQMNQANQQ